MAEILGAVPIDATAWWAVICCAFAPLAIIEIYKLQNRRESFALQGARRGVLSSR